MHQHSTTATQVAGVDVWDQLRDFQYARPFSKIFDLVVGYSTPATTQPSHSEIASAAISVKASTAPPNENATLQYHQDSSAQLFAMFTSKYFLFTLFVGFIISRVQILVRRQRVRPLRTMARIALYAPSELLLIRSIAGLCIALARTYAEHPGTYWMQDQIASIASLAKRTGLVSDSLSIEDAMWNSYMVISLFDCLEVFISRLEGSPVSPYEQIGSLMEGGSMYYFYGSLQSVQELALVGMIEHLALNHLFISMDNGWQWRLVPTGIGSLLTMHHFVTYFVRGQTYPVVQMASSVLLLVGIVVVVSGSVIWYSSLALSRLLAPNPMAPSGRAEVTARYGPDGSFLVDQEIADPHEDSVELMPRRLDWRHDFAAEVMELAGAALRQYGDQFRISGFSRRLSPMRMPKATVLDVKYGRSLSVYSGRSPFAVYLDEEPSDVVSADQRIVATVVENLLRDTRAGALRDFAASLWALCYAVGCYAVVTVRKPRSANAMSAGVGRGDGGRPRRLPDNGPLYERGSRDVSGRHLQGAQRKAGSLSGALGINSTDVGWNCESADDADEALSDSDFEYIEESDESSSLSDEEEPGDGMLEETAGLVSDIFDEAQNSNEDQDSSALMVFLAHVLFGDGHRSDDGSVVLTRSRFRNTNACGVQSAMSRTSQKNPEFVGSRGGELSMLANVVRSRRAVVNSQNDDSANSGFLCVVCWSNNRTVMLRPCRCLCICDECRNTLSARQFKQCPCCRRDVIGYSRVYAV